MAKKRQQDFQKQKLRPGRSLPKGQNVTDTSFKTKKIVTRDQLKAVPGDVSLKELLKLLGHNNVTTKADTLLKLRNFVLEKKDTLTLFFPEILTKVGRILLESNTNLREVAINVTDTCLRLLTDVQTTCFFPTLSSYLNCMMTHHSNTIRKDSLTLLDKILSSHPNVICNSTTVLNSLLNLISSMVHKPSLAHKGVGRKRKLDELISSNMTSQEWRVQVLTRIYKFLRCTLGVENVFQTEVDDDEKEVCWDAQKPLYLPLYLGGGPTPVPLESLNCNTSLKNTNSKEFTDFIYDLVPLLSDVIKGEVLTTNSSKIVDPSVIKHLNIVVQVLCCLGEWIMHKQNPTFTKDEDFKKLLKNIVCQQLLQRFPYAQHDSSYGKKKHERKSGADCLSLNLGICYLYSMLILDSDFNTFSKESAVITYMQTLFGVSLGMCYESVSLMLKTSKIWIVSNKVNLDFKNGILSGLYKILEVHKLSLLAKPIYIFFMDVSLDYDLKCLLDLAGMETWLNGVLREMVFMLESDTVNKKILKYIRQMCARRYPYFMAILNRVQNDNFIRLLKYPDEDFQLTVIHLIYALDEPCDLFHDLTDLLTDPSISLKTATRLINLLHARFSDEKARGKEKLLFLQFLLNLGCDTPVLTDPSWKSDEEIPDELKTVLDSCHFEIHPSKKWERHSKITKTCFDCLPAYMQIDALTDCTVRFIKALLLENTKLPIHCAIALLKLRKEAYDIYQDENLGEYYSELIFSSLMYLSVMNLDNKKDGLEAYAISELQKSLQIERDDMPDIISIINGNIYNFGENELYHTLRATKFLINENILHLDDRNAFYGVLEKINLNCQRSKLLHPLWISICKFFRFM